MGNEQIVHKGQHPLRHKAQDINYTNTSYPTIVTAKQALDDIYTSLATVLSWQEPVATKAALPLTGNSVNDARIVEDDGDGGSAIYVCIATTGDVDTQWQKIADVDWGTFLAMSDTPSAYTTAKAIYTVNAGKTAVFETTVVLDEGTNTFSITKGTASLDIAAGATLDVNFDFTVDRTITSIKDEDNMSSDSDTSLATQQSIKAYVDAEVLKDDTRTVTTGTFTAGTSSEVVILCDTSGGAITVNLPAAASNAEREFVIKKITSDSNQITVDGNASETIDGELTKIIGHYGVAMRIVCDGSNWFVV